MFKVMRGWFGDSADVRKEYPDSSWYSGNFDSKIEQCGAEVAAPKIDWSQYSVVEFVREDTLAQCIDMFYSDDSPVEYVSTAASDIGNIADTWLHNESSIAVNVTRITDCIKEIQHQRQATNSVKEAHTRDGSKWLTLSYETCVRDKASCLDKVAKLLGVDQFALSSAGQY